MQTQFSTTKILLVLLASMVFVSAHLCNHNEAVKIQLEDFTLIKTNTYQFNIQFQSAQTYINKNAQNGTNFKGNFSFVTLKNRQNQSFVYDASQLSFQCPAIHRPKKINQQIIQLQIIHRSKNKLQNQHNKQYPFHTIVLSFPFMISEFVPTKNKQLKTYINQSFENGQFINLQNLLSTTPEMPIVIYKGTHSMFPKQQVLYLVRKQLRLLSKNDAKQIQALMQPYMQLQKVQTGSQLKQNSVPNKLYQIKPFKKQQKQDL